MKINLIAKGAKKLIYIWPEQHFSPKRFIMRFRPKTSVKLNVTRPNEFSIEIPTSVFKKLARDRFSKQSQSALRTMWYAASFEPQNIFEMPKPICGRCNCELHPRDPGILSPMDFLKWVMTDPTVSE